jgi:tetratricopeptide (TPR) repeat protein
VPGYRATCADLFERFGRSSSPNTLNTLAWIGALVPDSGIKPAVLVQCAEQAVNDNPKSPSYLNTLSLALHRAGRFEDALRRIQEAIALQSKGGSVWDWLILVMTHERLGQREQARQWLDKSQRPSTEGLAWHERLELRLLRREAQSRIGSESP